MTPDVPRHPAPFSDPLFPVFAEAIDAYASDVEPLRVLDPFAGIGRVHRLQDETMTKRRLRTTGVEILPRYAAAHQRTRVGDATELPARWSGRFQVVVTSPCYGNRMADHHNANDPCSECKGTGQVWPGDGTVRGLYDDCPKCKGTGLSPRRSYRHWYGGPDDEFFLANNAGAMHWGPEYKRLHVDAWTEVHRVLAPGGIFILNVKDFIENHERVRACDWHRRTVERVGFDRLCTYTVPLPGARYGQNHQARIPNEFVYVFERT